MDRHKDRIQLLEIISQRIFKIEIVVVAMLEGRYKLFDAPRTDFDVFIITQDLDVNCTNLVLKYLKTLLHDD
jgi:hypothetical protein